MRSRSGANTAPLCITRRRLVRRRARQRELAVGAAADAAPGTLTAGLGLSLARRIAEMHGGALEDDGAAGEVVLTLPAA